MVQVQENIFQKFCKLSQQIQKTDQEIHQQDVSPKKRDQLHKTVESLQGSLEMLRNKAKETGKLIHAQLSQMEEMHEQIIRMYRDIEDRFEEYEIEIISKKALGLKATLESGKMLKVAKIVDSLSHNIVFLFKHRRPSLAHRKIVHIASKLVDHAKELLASKGGLKKEKTCLIHILTRLLQEALLRSEQMIDPHEAELAMELLAIADLYFNKKRKEAALRLNLVRHLMTRGQQMRLEQAQSDEEKVQLLLMIADGDEAIELLS